MYDESLYKILPDELIKDIGIYAGLQHVREIRLRIGRLPAAICDNGEHMGTRPVDEHMITKHTVIISPPGFGKTTLLRDIIRQLSDKYRKNVVLIDERCEIAACVNGVPCNDIGCRTDVLDGCNKLTGVYMAVRSLSPQVVAMDEIGCEDDIKAVKYCIKTGCTVIGTAHGSSIYDTDERLTGLFAKSGFKRAVILEKCGEAGKCLDI